MAGAQEAEPPLTAHFRIRRAPDREPVLTQALALFLLVVGIALGAGGAMLVLLGGSFYYLLGGIAVGASGMLLRWGRRDGLRLYAGFLLATLLWSLWEVGLDAWALGPRLVGPALVGLVLGLPWIGRALADDRRRPFPPLQPARAGLLLLAVTLIAALLETGPPAVSGHVATDRAALAAIAGIPGEWPAFGRDLGGDRFTPIAQITPANVAGLKPAWIYRSGILPGFARSPVETTPIMIGDGLYLCTPASVVIALDPDSGRVRWRYDPRVDPANGSPQTTCRGVAYYRADTADCPERIIAGTADGRLLALDARTGRLCPAFGKGGTVDLRAGLGRVAIGTYSVSSAPTIVDGRIIVGARVDDDESLDMPSGVIRAFDAVTGKLAWAWDMGRPGDGGQPAARSTFTRSTPNSWAPMSADDLLGLVYVPTGNAAVDHWGAARSRAAERFGSALVALDAASGVPRWSFQTTHHDLWDYDVSAQPTLFDMPTKAGPVPAVVEPTKRGELFVLDRRTGAPLATVRERPAPQRGAVPGEKPAATQPFAIGMPEFAGPPLAETRMWGLTPLDQLWCRIAFRKLRYDGPLTPPGTDRALIDPGIAGGVNWGGVSLDPVRGLMFVNSLYYPTIVELVPRAEADRAIAAAAGKPHRSATPSPQAGSPFGVRLTGFESPLRVPCAQPPYGRLAAVDLATRRLLWSRPIGSARGSGPFRMPSHLPLGMGVPQFGGSLATASGLLFIGATEDRTFRAIDSASGRILWSVRIPGNGQANPMSYVSPKSGRQFVVIAAGGHGLIQPPSDAIVAYALPPGRR